YPPGTSPGEILVFEKLRRCPSEWIVLHSLHIPEHVRQVEGEADFIVLIPGRGVLCLEVKGHLQAEYRDGAWYLGKHAAPGSRRPTRSDCLAMRKILRPDVHFVPAMATIRRDRINEIRRFTDEQIEAIEGLDGVNARALVEGPAGTGKTVLALEEARRASAD